MKENIGTIIEYWEELPVSYTLDSAISAYNSAKDMYIETGDRNMFADMFIHACNIARFSFRDSVGKFAVTFNNIQEEELERFEKLVDEKMELRRENKGKEIQTSGK